MSIKPLCVKTVSRYLGSACSAAMIIGWGALAHAQVTISDERTAPIDTATEGDDVIIDTTGTVTLTGPGPAVTLNSDNDLTNNGAITINDVNDATGVLLQGGADRNFTNAGSIILNEDFTPTDEDGDRIADGPFAQGSGRTGILISGASPFDGDVNLSGTSNVSVEGNNSFGMRLVEAAIMNGDITNQGQITLLGDNGAAVSLEGSVNGNVVNQGTVSSFGGGSSAYNISGDVQGGFVNSGALGSNGFRLTQRPPFGGPNGTGFEDLSAEDLLEAGSVVAISGNISQGVHFDIVTEEVLDADGNGTGTFAATRTSSLTQTGSAPAVLIAGDGTPIAIGRVATITDPAADGFDENLQFAFVNEGTIAAQGVYDDFDATVVSISNASLEGGLNNTGTLSVSTFRGAGTRTIEGVTPGTGNARVIVLGEGAIVDQINNTGTITAQASEALDEVFADQANPLGAVSLQVTAIDIGANATTGSLYNSGTIAALAIGREGELYAIRDSSGSLNSVTNEGSISAFARNSDSTGLSDVNFTLVAIDASSNTTGFTYTQQRREDTDLTDEITPPNPTLLGEIRLGSGDDAVISTAGTILGDIDFGAGVDTLTLSGESLYAGNISNTGDLTIDVTDGSGLTLLNSAAVLVTDATFDSTSSFIPTLNGASGTASTLSASGAVTFADGATITPRFSSIITNPNGQAFTIADAANLNVSDVALAALNA